MFDFITFQSVEQLKLNLNHQKTWENTLGNAYGILCACTIWEFLSKAIFVGTIQESHKRLMFIYYRNPNEDSNLFALCITDSLRRCPNSCKIISSLPINFPFILNYSPTLVEPMKALGTPQKHVIDPFIIMKIPPNLCQHN